MDENQGTQDNPGKTSFHRPSRWRRIFYKFPVVWPIINGGLKEIKVI